MHHIYVGEISEEWQKNWGKEHEPYDVLDIMFCINAFFGSGGEFYWTDKHCTDEVKVDWGSYAWKCKGKELIELLGTSSFSEDFRGEVKTLCIEQDKEYGVVFIEDY